MEGFVLDTTLFTQQELSAVFTGLKSLDSDSFSQSADKLAQKTGADSAISLSDHMMMDLSSFYRPDLAYKIEQIKSAINNRVCIVWIG